MELKLAHIRDLNNMMFNIPYYQRGFRWEKKQVRQLLEDLFEYSETKQSQFYCLQPLVVVKNPVIKTKNGLDVYDVIDGQQRLTTIFLILGYLNKNLFSLRYERMCKPNQQSYEDGELHYKDLLELDPQRISDNADYFYLQKAIECIEEFDKDHSKKYDNIIEESIKDILYPGKFQKDVSEEYMFSSAEDKNNYIQDARFIWYEIQDNSQQSSIAIFKRMNYGKTTLTSTELIKALLFQCDNYSDGEKEIMKEKSFRMATEWDNMEKYLQDPFVWGMLSHKDYKTNSHIDIILSFVASELEKEQNKNKNADTNNQRLKFSNVDTYHDYLVFYNSINDYTVEELWAKIQDTFAIFSSWFEDREIYHLTGLYIMLKNKREEHLKILRELYDEYNRHSKQEYIRSLKKKIFNLIFGNNTKYTDGIVRDLNYIDNYEKINKILLLHNVNICIKNDNERSYFPFMLCRQLDLSLEHIHPQNMNSSDIKFDDLCNWYTEKKECLSGLETSEELKSVIEDLKTVLIVGNEKTYNEDKEKYNEKIRMIDSYFDELAEINPQELHSIANLALLDKDTNASLSNNLMDSKRMKLKKAQSNGVYIFPTTKMVFNKEFSDKVQNLKFWTKQDRDAYLENIEKTLEEYGK